jgi:DNA ligase-1
MHEEIQQLRNFEGDFQDDTSTQNQLKGQNVLFGCALATRWQPTAKHNTQEVTVLNNTVLRSEEWYFMPKYDGVRCRWNGSVLYSRSGLTEYGAPSWFTAALPTTLSLDGELWIARNTFETTLSAVKGSDWTNIKYVVFDCPSFHASYRKRLAYAQEQLNNHLKQPLPGRNELTPQCIKVVGCEERSKNADTELWCERLQNIDEVKQALDREQQLFGEGLMARRNDALYLPGRSNSLVKIKAKRDDEAIVVHCGKGLGHFQGQMGYLWCRTRWGAEFDLNAGLTKEQRQWNTAANKALREGTVITFTYTDLTLKRKRPKQAVFVRVREDVSASEFPGWECIGDVKQMVE